MGRKLGVVVYGRDYTYEYPSLSSCLEDYPMPDRDTLVRAIEQRQVWSGDGYTTFDWAVDADPDAIESAVKRSMRHYKWVKRRK